MDPHWVAELNMMSIGTSWTRGHDLRGADGLVLKSGILDGGGGGGGRKPGICGGGGGGAGGA